MSYCEKIIRSRFSEPCSQVGSPKIASCHNSSATDKNTYCSTQVWNYSNSDTELCVLFSRSCHPPSATDLWFAAFENWAVCGQIQHYPWKFNELVQHLLERMECISKLNTAHLWLSFSERPGYDSLTQPKIDMSHGLFFVMWREEWGRRKET